ncbi:MAG TPA: hypothetical protein VLB32_07065 [Candidatus Acidoferrales bacterium]|nr:hypothetical protein [Candidatus Acidoferrales bacterium]
MSDDGAVPVLNYYTQIEEYFWQKRGAHLLVSTLDWAVIETWQRAGIPLEVVLKGIDRAFERYDAKRRGRPIKSLLYCVDAVADAAEEAKEAAAGGATPGARPAPFVSGEVPAYLRANAASLREAAQALSASGEDAAVRDIAAALEALAEQPATQNSQNLEDLERHLTVFEEKLLAALTQAASADELVELRREVERGLAPYRRKMKAEQLAMIEKQFLQKKLFERYNLPRLSLFYLPVGSAAPPGEGA